ncbi:chromate transporter [Bryobacter aggregatus]|uniref:chromate transporter n=1 Tax=Bryobacter aggregatus TaxID=360054 RepID=UPI0004E1F503|nr:chromate transporter [Bryobacter aggregatus]
MGARPSFLQLCRVLLKHAAFTVGGGSVTTIALERDLVDHHGWLSRDRYRALYGLSRLTPGTSILAMVTGIGWHFFQWRGACVSLFCAVVPASILAALLASAYQLVYQNPTAKRFLLGAAAAVCGFIAASLFGLLSPYLKDKRFAQTFLIFAFAFAVAIWGLNPFPVILGLAIAGLVSAR